VSLRNNRIVGRDFLNHSCVIGSDIESILRRETPPKPFSDSIDPNPPSAKVSSYKIHGCNSVVSTHSALIPAALIIGHHFSALAFTSALSISGVCCSCGKTSVPISASRVCTPAPPKPLRPPR